MSLQWWEAYTGRYGCQKDIVCRREELDSKGRCQPPWGRRSRRRWAQQSRTEHILITFHFSQGAIRGTQYVKNYEFEYNFGGSWGQCSVVFTSVAGHLMNEDFPQAYGWNRCEPIALFTAPIERTVAEASTSMLWQSYNLLTSQEQQSHCRQHQAASEILSKSLHMDWLWSRRREHWCWNPWSCFASQS